MLNKEIERNKEMLDTLDHVSKTCVGSYGYLTDIMLWLARKSRWEYLYEGTYRCAYCKELVNCAEDNNYMPKYRYCPYCGAVMSEV